VRGGSCHLASNDLLMAVVVTIEPRGFPVYQTNQNKRLRSALLLGAASAAVIGLSAPASAQDSSSVETVVVTGSRIPQQGLYSSSPVTAVGQQELKLEGTTNVATLLNNLPSVVSGQQSFTGNASTGTATVDLRGLGAVRTLVLIDGKRMAPGDPVVPTADLNQIPAALVDHVEVLTGGASAVYGSDAVAGVVNFILRKDFEGVELDGQFSGNQHNNDNSSQHALLTAAGGPVFVDGLSVGFNQAPSNVFDGQGVDSTLLMGVNAANGKGNITGYFGYKANQQVLQSARDYSACTIDSYVKAGSSTYNGFRCAGSANYDLFAPKNGPAAGEYFFMQPGGHLEPFTGASHQYFNYGPINSMQRPDTRYTGGFFAHYQVDPMLDFYSSFMFTDDHTRWQAAPSALFDGAGPVAGAVQVNCDNPLAAGTDFVADFCPGGVPSAFVVNAFTGRRNVEGGPRITDFRHTTYRMVVGAKGDLGSGWSYDVSAQFSTSLFQQLYLHDLSISRVENALNSNVCATVSGCVPLDIFHGIGGFTPAMLNYIYTHGQQAGSTEEQVLTGALTGDLGAWGIQSPWAKSPVAVSIGAEYRAEYLELTTSDADQHNDLYGAGGVLLGTPRSGFNVSEGFGEVQVPLVQGVPFFEDLSLNGGYRYSSYNTAGGVTSYKVGAEWQIVDDVKLRGSFNRAVRAPNVLELFTPQAAGLGSFEDPCGGAVPTATAAQCANSGVTAAQYGHIGQCPASQCKQLLGGNPGLAPETSDTKSFGIVLTPTFLDGFTATIDYFDIKVNQAISSVSPGIALNSCLAGNLSLCSLVHRDPNGLLFTTAGYVIATNTNTGFLGTKGVDFEGNYNVDLNDWNVHGAGSLAFNFVGTWTEQKIFEPYTGSTATLGGKTFTDYDCAGLYGQTCGVPTPTWRHKLRATWATPWDVDLSLAWRHMGGTTFDGNSPNAFLHLSKTLAAGSTIPAFDYFDLAGSWQVSEGVSLRAGVNNIFDKNPPLLPSGGVVAGPTGPLNGNTFPGVYDPLGRYIFIGGTVKF
jgi:iron complex outermembrane receptor protein